MDRDYFRRRHRIRSQRLGIWDYSFSGYYFITTVLLQRHLNLLSSVNQRGKVILKPFGKSVDDQIRDIKYWDPQLIVDEYVIMPDHIHILLSIAPGTFHNGFSKYQIDERYQQYSKTFNRLIYQMDKYYEKEEVTEAEVEKYEELKKNYRSIRRKMLVPKVVGRLKAQSSKNFNIHNNTPGRKNWLKDYHCSVVTPTSYYRVKRYIQNNPIKYQGKPPNLVRRMRKAKSS